MIRLRSTWLEARDSLWFLPAILTGAAVLLAYATIWVDGMLQDRQSDLGWFFSGGAEGARGVLSAIASTMITVTALVFSITVVALQLAASQLTPRVLHAFMGDRANQVVLGFFISTFTYSLLVLRAVRAPLDGGGGFVPSLSVTIAIVLALVSVGLLIFFVHHAANSMRTSVTINRTANTALGLIEQLVPEDEGQDTERPRAAPAWLETEGGTEVPATRGGYLKEVDEASLLAMAERRSLTVRAELSIGDFLLPGAVLARVWPAAAVDDEVTGVIREALVLGTERSPHQDPAYGLQMLVDIAVRALSPGVNDPTTAIICIDRLSQAIALAGGRAEPDPLRRDEAGRVRLILAVPSFAQLVDIAFASIRWHGAGDPIVAAHLITSLGRIATLVPAARRPALERQATHCLAAARDQAPLPDDQARLLAAASWLPPTVKVAAT